MNIAASGNTQIPSYELLIEKGYAVVREEVAGNEKWTASKDGALYSAGSPLELLGLVTLGESKGEGWRVSDEAIDAFLHKFWPDST